MPSENQLALLSVDQRNQLELILMDFDVSWEPDLLEDYVQKIVSLFDDRQRQVTLSELVKIDLQRGWVAGEGILLEEYCRKLPALGTPETLDPELILIELEARRETDPQLDLQSYESRFPNQFAAVSNLFAEEQRSESAAPGDQASIQTSRAGDARDTSSPRKQEFSGLPLQFDRYRILRELGSGAMGAVYLAYDTQLDRQVALKTPSFDGVKDEELIVRFYREAKAAAKLQHRNICPIYDVGEIQGRNFIAMAYIKGRCLSEFIASGKLPPVKTTAILILRLANALAEAHHHNVVHRDLKPANIMVDLKKEPVVMDFGLARQTDVETRVTHSGMLVGTPAYMSPEQIVGDQQDVGPQADIYSLGVIMYELLSGQLPFRGSIAQVVHQITSAEPTPPSQLRSEVDAELEAICGWMMAKDRAKRFQSMDEVASALRKYLKTPNVKTDVELSNKYARPSVGARKPPVFQAADESHESTDDASTYALKEYFGVEAADPRQTAVEELSDSLKPLCRMTSAGRNRDGHRKLLLAGGFAGGFLLLLGIIIYFNGGKIEFDDGANGTVEVDEEGRLIVTPHFDPSSLDSAATPVVLPIAELNIGEYNTSPWPSRDGLRLYWESTRSEANQPRTVTLMAARPNVRSKFGPPKIVAEGRMATLSPNELEIVCVPNQGQKSLHTGRRSSLSEPFSNLQPLNLANEPENPKSPCISPDGLKLVVQSGTPEANEFLISTRISTSHAWSPFQQFGRMHERYHQNALTWPFVSNDGLRIWYGKGGDSKTEIWTGTRSSKDDPFGEFVPVTWQGKPLVGRAPRYVAATHELYFARPVGEMGWELAVLKNYRPDGDASSEFVPLFNGKDLSGWTVIGHNGWKVGTGNTLVGQTNQDKGWLMSNDSFGDFELELEYLLEPDSNSGIFLRAWPEGAVNGADFHEVQLLDDTSDKYRDLPRDRRTGAMYKQLDVSSVVRPEPNKWHKLSIKLEGRHLQVSIDGQKVTDGLIPQDKPVRGRVGLQLYPTEVQFWNIRIKDLDRSN